MKHGEIIADNLSNAGWSCGCVSAVDSEGGTIWITDAHRSDGKRFVVRADEKLTAFLELQRGICIHLLSEQCLLRDGSGNYRHHERENLESHVRILSNCVAYFKAALIAAQLFKYWVRSRAGF